MKSGREWLGMVASKEDTDIEELVLCESKVAKHGAFVNECECGVLGCQVQHGHKFVDSWVKKCFRRSINCVNVRLLVTL